MKKQLVLGLAIAGVSCPVFAQQSAGNTQSMQQQINSLETQLQQLKQQMKNQQANPSGSAPGGGGQGAQVKQEPKKPKQKLNIGGGVVTEYQVRDSSTKNKRDGGDFILDYFDLNATGQYGDLTFSADYRWSTVNFADPSYLHYGWAAYDFGPNKSSQIKGGMFQVPFGILPYGYQTFWGNLAYYLGVSDAQAAGLGYKYEANGLRLDVDAFKNDDLEQNSTYGAAPFNGYQQINGGNVRLGYTIDQGNDNTVDLSASFRGGQLEVGDSRKSGTRWAGALGADVALGDWTLQGQAVAYKYNIPDNATNGVDGDGNTIVLPTSSLNVENYGFGYQIPNGGQVYSANVARDFSVAIGPIDSFQIYNNYNYLHANNNYDTDGFTDVGDTQFDAVGGLMTAGPVYIWADVLFGKNAASAFLGPNDGDWHTRFNLTLAFYFDGDLVKE